MLKAALAYARLGLKVFPMFGLSGEKCTCGNDDCEDQGRHPACERGHKDATTDEQKIRGWFSRGGRNIALAPDGTWWALDVDGDEGETTLAGLEEKHGQKIAEMSIAIASTPHGRHYLFGGDPQELKNWTGEAMGLHGLDVRKEGSSIHVYPSKQKSGVYTWIKNLHPKKWDRAPSWLVAELADGRARKKEARQKEREARRKDRKRIPSAIDQGPAIRRYLDRALDEEVYEVAIEPEHGRNHRLNEAAFSLGTLFHLGLSEDEAYRALYDAALKSGLKPLEIDSTIRSGFTGGASNPRSVVLNQSRPETSNKIRKAKPQKTDIETKIKEVKKDDISLIRPILQLVSKRDEIEQEGWVKQLSTASGVTIGTLKRALKKEAQADVETPGDVKPRDLAYTVACGLDMELFPSTDGESFARLKDGRIVRCTPKGATLSRLITRKYQSKYSTVAPQTAINDALATLQAEAHGTPQRQIYKQVAPYKDGLLVRARQGKAYLIEPGRGYREIDTPRDVVFFRGDPPFVDDLPSPVQGGSVAELLGELFPQMTQDQLILVAGWLLGALQPPAPYPMLFLYGPHGSGKSSVAQTLKEIIDPEPIKRPEGEKGRDLQDVVAAVAPQHIHVLDNLSSIDSTLSDALCRMSTGGLFSRRKLYTDSDKAMTFIMTPLIATSITEVARRSDLLDRAIIIDLAPLDTRATEAEVLRRLKDRAPKILHALFMAASQALTKLVSYSTPQLRMADFARWVACGAGEHMGFDSSDFLEAYEENVSSAKASATDSDPVVDAILELLEDRIADKWAGSIGSLYADLSDLIDESLRRSRAWPSSPTALAGRLNRLKSELLSTYHVDVQKRRERTGGRRPTVWVVKTAKQQTTIADKDQDDG